MKRPKRPGEWQDSEVDSAEHTSFDLDMDDVEEEIIELEDVFEIPEEATAASAGIADADSELDLKDFDFDLQEEEVFLEDDLEHYSFDEEKVLEAHSGKRVDAPQEAFRDQKEEDSFDGRVEPISPIVNELEPVKAEEPPLAEPEAAVEEKRNKVSLDDFVNQIEDRLLEALQQMVEARLPDIVRTVLREEIDRLKQEMEEEKA